MSYKRPRVLYVEHYITFKSCKKTLNYWVSLQVSGDTKEKKNDRCYRKISKHVVTKKKTHFISEFQPHSELATETGKPEKVVFWRWMRIVVFHKSLTTTYKGEFNSSKIQTLCLSFVRHWLVLSKIFLENLFYTYHESSCGLPNTIGPTDDSSETGKRLQHYE